MDEKQTLAQRVIDERRRLGLSQRTLSAAVGKPSTYINSIENGEALQGSVEKIINLAQALGVKVSWLVTGEGRKR